MCKNSLHLLCIFLHVLEIIYIYHWKRVKIEHMWIDLNKDRGMSGVNSNDGLKNKNRDILHAGHPLKFQVYQLMN